MKIENNRDKKKKASKKNNSGSKAIVIAGALIVNIYVWAGLGAGLSLLGHVTLPDVVMSYIGAVLIAYVVVGVFTVSAYGVTLMTSKED